MLNRAKRIISELENQVICIGHSCCKQLCNQKSRMVILQSRGGAARNEPSSANGQPRETGHIIKRLEIGHEIAKKRLMQTQHL